VVRVYTIHIHKEGQIKVSNFFLYGEYHFWITSIPVIPRAIVIVLSILI
jgi:hypothetical protein